MSSNLSTAPVDSAKLEELRELFGDNEEVVGLFRDFFQELPQHLETLRRAVQDHSQESIHRTAHTLKGSSGGLGATGLQEAAFALEKTVHEKNLDHAAQKLVLLEAEAERLRTWLSQQGML